MSEPPDSPEPRRTRPVLPDEAPQAVPATPPTAPGRPVSHRRADAGAPSPVVRVLPSLAAVTVVVFVIVALLVLNGRSTPRGSGPAVSVPSSSASGHSTPSHAPRPSTTATSSATVPPPVAEPSATQTAVAAKIPVTVLNNSRRAGLAHDVATQLRAQGWPIAAVGNFTGRIAETTVYYAPGQLAAARELAREFAGIRRVELRFAGLPGHGLTLVVTRDWP